MQFGLVETVAACIKDEAGELLSRRRNDIIMRVLFFLLSFVLAIPMVTYVCSLSSC